MTTSNVHQAVRVREIVAITPLVKRFRFEPINGSITSFSGGSHVVVEMIDGDVVRRNAYSLMGCPTDTSNYMISVRRDDSGRGGSRFMHGLVEGSVVKISHPVNLFPLATQASKHLLIAGGIGITPFIPMTEQLIGEQRLFELHYACRSKESAAYADELAERFGRRVTLYYSDRSNRLDVRRVLSNQPLGTHLYVCGPANLIEHTINSALINGWPQQNLHVEHFLAPAVGAPYQVTLQRSKAIVSVGPTQSMLEAIEEAGVDAPHLCRGGACGQCETRVVSCDGTLLHADHFLSAEERSSNLKVMPCVSRFEGKRLVLDL